MKRNQNKSRKFMKVGAVLVVLLSLALAADHGSAAQWSPKKEILSFMQENYPWKDVDVISVRVLGAVREIPPGRIIVEKGPLGRAVFSFFYPNNERSTVYASVRASGKVVKTKRSFSKNHVLGEGDLYVSKMDINKMPKGSISDPSAIVGKPLKRSVRANGVILDRMVEMSPVVARGKRVLLLIEGRGMSITAAGVTREKGEVGTTVRAINLSTKKEVTGVLINEETLKVHM
jgi:flagella basal body P-ring formation protein FlgA